MKVRALKAFHDAHVRRAGDVYEEDDAVAKDRVKAGLVEKVKDEPEPKGKAKG